MMRHPWRVFAGLIGLLAGLLIMHATEQVRAMAAPSGWARTDTADLASAGGNPRFGSSVWRLMDGTNWEANEPANQLYVRANRVAGARLRISLDGESWVGIGADDIPRIERPEGSPACMGALRAPEKEQVPLVLEHSTGGLTVQWGQHRTICAGKLAAGAPRIEVRGGSVDLRSIGRDKMSDGVPVSPLGWLAGILTVGFSWIVMTEIALSRRVPFSWLAVCWIPVPSAWLVFVLDLASLPQERTAFVAMAGTLALTVLVSLVGGPIASVSEE